MAGHRRRLIAVAAALPNFIRRVTSGTANARLLAVRPARFERSGLWMSIWSELQMPEAHGRLEGEVMALQDGPGNGLGWSSCLDFERGGLVLS